jgi:signal transduction histidine kinase
MVLSLLDLSRIETGQLSIERAPVDLNTLIARVVEEVQPTLDRHPVELHLPAQTLTVTGDALRLEQVVQNLVQNAAKYSPAGGPITVELAAEDGSARLAVTDRGIGIPAAAIPQLFQRFYRAPNVETHQIAGMGVGLFVVREIVGLHGGAVDVQSTEGAGSTFTVRLPLLAAAAQAAVAS